MKIELMRGIMHGKDVLVINDRRVSGMKDGRGYVTVKEFEVSDEEARALLDKEQNHD